MAVAAERYLVTGAFGCIGAWVVKRLTDEGVSVTTYDLPGEPARLKLIMKPDQLDTVTILAGDITDEAAFERAVVDNGITNLIHLAALQVPFVRKNPVLGARVNMVGTAVVFETVRRHADQVNGIVYASSTAVYGPPSMYPPGPLAADAPLGPVTLYGVTKVANEEWARLYWLDYQTRSIGLRPFFVYGPGRDQGVSSTPTKAMVAAAVNQPYHISFGGSALFQHADDVAAAMIQASRRMPDGAPVFNLGGTHATVSDVIAAIETAMPGAKGTITSETEPLFTPEGASEGNLEQVIGTLHWRSLQDGVRQTIQHVQSAVKQGTIDIERAIN